MISVGIDPALNHTGIATLRNGKLLHSDTWRTNSKGVERLVDLRRQLVALIERARKLAAPNELVWFGLEDYAWSLGLSAHQMGEWGGQIRVVLQDHDIIPVIFNQSEVKKYATGKGTSKKDILLMHVGKKWRHTFDSSDEAEAFLIADMLYWIYAIRNGRKKPEELEKYKLEVLLKHLRRA